MTETTSWIKFGHVLKNSEIQLSPCEPAYFRFLSMGSDACSTHRVGGTPLFGGQGLEDVSGYPSVVCLEGSHFGYPRAPSTSSEGIWTL